MATDILLLKEEKRLLLLQGAAFMIAAGRVCSIKQCQ